MVKCLEIDGNAAVVVKEHRWVFLLECHEVCDVVYFGDVGKHRPTWEEAALVLVDRVLCQSFPSNAARRGQQAVVRVGDGKWSCVVAVECLCPVWSGDGRFFGRQTRMAWLKSG